MENGNLGWGEVNIRIPGVCLSPSHLRQLTGKRMRRRGILSWTKAKRLAEEFLYVPYYYFHYLNPKHRGHFYLYNLLVDGVLGFSEFIRGSFELKEFRVSRELVLERAISRDEAESRAKKAVEAFALRRQSWWIKEIKAELVEAGELHFPYWVCYLETSKGVELFALNGLTGSPAGPRPENVLKAGIARCEWKGERS